MKKQTVCLIGKPNTGKSTLFNRLIKEKKSIILDTPGVTRDRIYGDVNYLNYNFLLIDTGGIESGSGNFNESIKIQANIAIEESDVIIFVVDVKTGITSDDLLVRDLLLKSQKKVIVAVNKIDNKNRENDLYEFYSLGFEEVIPISAEHNKGVNDLLNKVVENFKETKTLSNDDYINFCVIGRPNVGKSSLINALLDKERAIVSDVAGTTRDATEDSFTYNGQKFKVVDTAGMRKKGKIDEAIEKYSLIRSIKAITKSDVCVIVIDADTGIIEHDKHIVSYALSENKAIVLVINKWDLIKDKEKSLKKWKEEIKNNFQFIPYANTVFLSALKKEKVGKLMPLIVGAYQNYTKTIKTSLLNDVINDAVKLHMPPSYKNKRLKIYFVSQTGVMPPKFTFFVNNKGLIHFSYERYLENKIRENFDLQGTPIIMQFKNKNEE